MTGRSSSTASKMCIRDRRHTRAADGGRLVEGADCGRLYSGGAAVGRQHHPAPHRRPYRRSAPHLCAFGHYRGRWAVRFLGDFPGSAGYCLLYTSSGRLRAVRGGRAGFHGDHRQPGGCAGLPPGAGKKSLSRVFRHLCGDGQADRLSGRHPQPLLRGTQRPARCV